MRKEYITTPTSFMATIAANPLMTVVYSATHKLFFMQPENDEEEFALIMGGAVLYRGDPTHVIDIASVVEIMQLWKSDVPELPMAIADANVERKKAKLPTIKQR